MQTYSIPKFIISVVLFIFSSLSSAQEKTAPFDYTKTVWIINVINSSGVVYGRPRPEDYNARHGFIYIYETLNKYVYSLQDINTSAGSLTVTHELVLINGTTEQRILLGDHWISDETKIAVMDEHDYQNLKKWLAGREKDKDSKENPPIDKLVDGFKKITSPEVDNFNNYFNRNPVSSTRAEAYSSTAATPLSLPKQNDSPSKSQSSQLPNKSPSSVHSEYQRELSKATAITPSNTDQVLAKSANAKLSSSNNLVKERNDDKSISLWLKILFGLLAVFFLVRYWWSSKE